ncbi:MAG: hypothetical protein HC892_01330 [Saprospiraceae bacterium]|nr:hypothetical protein [Saprospiraceae bacterium]
MATVIRASVSIVSDIDSLNEMEELVNNYWGSPVEEKVFPIPFWQLNQLFDAASTKEIAFKVTNIDNPSLANAEWVVFEEGMEELLADTRRDEHYFVMNESVFRAMRAEIPELTKPLHTIIILGRIGVIQNSNTHYCIDSVDRFYLTQSSRKWWWWRNNWR